MNLYQVHAPGLTAITLSAINADVARQTLLDYARAFHPRRQWQPENITVTLLVVGGEVQS